MTFQTRTHRRWVRRLALGLVVAAIAAPSAQALTPAEIEAADWAGVLGVEPAVVGPEFPTWAVNFARPALVGPEFPASTVNWAQPATDAPSTPVSAPGFDYRDAGIGAAIALGAALLAAAGLMLGRRRGKLVSA